MITFDYMTVWYVYICALALLGLSGYFILKPIKFRWLRWNLLAGVIVFLAAPLEISESWMVPGFLYFTLEYFFVGNKEAIAVLYQLIQHVGITLLVTSFLLLGLHINSTRS